MSLKLSLQKCQTFIKKKYHILPKKVKLKASEIPRSGKISKDSSVFPVSTSNSLLKEFIKLTSHNFLSPPISPFNFKIQPVFRFFHPPPPQLAKSDSHASAEISAPPPKSNVRNFSPFSPLCVCLVSICR